MRLLLLGLSLALLSTASDWTRFRGPNGSGVEEANGLPGEIGPEKNLLWRTEIQPGFSSPVLGHKCVFFTSWEGLKGFTACVDRAGGKELWRKEGFELAKKFAPVNTPVSATPVTDGKNVYVFFETAGLISYDEAGNERWRLPLGKFNNPYGMAASPILAGTRLIFQADQDTDSYLIAVDAKTGKQLWKVARPEAQHGYSTPVLYTPKGGKPQIITSGSFQVAGYSLESGEKLWWLDGMAWQAKSVPVLQGDMLYVHSWMAGLSELMKMPENTSWEDFKTKLDKDGDGAISKEEAPDKEMARLWFLLDLDRSGKIEAGDYKILQLRNTSESGLYAIRLGGKGDLGQKAIAWKSTRSLPNIPSPLLYRDVLYVLKEGGILTAYDPKTGDVTKQGRVEGATDPYFSSPVAADGKVFLASQTGNVAVLEAGAVWKVLSVNPFNEEIWATPALGDQRIYLRTQKALYCFGAPKM